MSQPRYNAQLLEFLNRWRPNDPELDKRFFDDVRALVAAIVQPPSHVFEVESILTPDGGKVVCRLGDYEAQLDPVQAHHLALSLIEGAASARVESFLMRFMAEKMDAPNEHAMGFIGAFRNYRIEELEKELAGDLAKQGVIPR